MSFSKLIRFDDYCEWVIKNSEILTQIETLGRMASYLIAGRFKSSPAISEFLYSATNIIVFVNDQILLNSNTEHVLHQSKDNLEKFRIFYTVLEYLQVFLEITATKIWNDHGKWAVVAAIQIIKFFWRIVVIVTKKSGMTLSKSIPPLNRRKLKNPSTVEKDSSRYYTSDRESTYCLKSGRVIRQVAGAPQVNMRNWKLPNPETHEETTSRAVISTQLEIHPLVGEVLFSMKPLCHLLAMACYGTTSWVPWTLALTIDVASLKLLKSGTFSGDDRKEFRRRQFHLLMYLLRSPFYDRFSRKIIFDVLISLRKIPFIGGLPQQIFQYLLFWQKIYSYTWD